MIILIAIIEWGGGDDQNRRLYEGGVNESWTKVDHGEEGVIGAQGHVDFICAQPLKNIKIFTPFLEKLID